MTVIFIVRYLPRMGFLNHSLSQDSMHLYFVFDHADPKFIMIHGIGELLTDGRWDHGPVEMVPKAGHFVFEILRERTSLPAAH
jgi:hypothetical protein